MRAIETCRTAVLGGHVDVCADCGHETPSYNSCRNRHCPKCRGLAQAKWIEQRRERILPVHYFHVVFTLPGELRPLAMYNRKLVYGLLFRAASRTLLTLGHDPARLGGLLGVTAVLHTWTRDLRFHPHLHCIVTGGGLSADGEEWKRVANDYLFPVRVMSRLFRGKFLDATSAEGSAPRAPRDSAGRTPSSRRVAKPAEARGLRPPPRRLQRGRRPRASMSRLTVLQPGGMLMARLHGRSRRITGDVVAVKLVQVDYGTHSPYALVAETLRTKRASQSDRGIGPLSCWAGISYGQDSQLKLATGFSQMKNELEGVSPYKNQWVKYHGELAALANAIEVVNSGSFSGGRLPIFDVYVEMSPCPKCRPALDNLLPDGTTVYYSFDYATQKDAWEKAARTLCKA